MLPLRPSWLCREAQLILRAALLCPEVGELVRIMPLFRGEGIGVGECVGGKD